MSTSDATPTYRGYRKQALYVLSRILETGADPSLIYEPEGIEDLSIRGQNGRLLEVVQVKDKSDDLTLSHFKPDQPDSFFYGARDRLRSNPQARLVLATYGRVGPELSAAVAGDAEARQKVASKLNKYRPKVGKDGKQKPPFISLADAEMVISRLEVVQLNEQDLDSRIRAQLAAGTPGVDVESAFQLLHFWIYMNSEAKGQIAYQDIIKRVNNVGRFAQERAAWNQEWFTAIVPVEDIDIADGKRAKLAEAFYSGIAVQYKHILADLDVPRPEKLQEISGKFQKSSVVIVHGASGQGKSALAYRYLREYFPDKWRFRVKAVEGRRHALSLARALSGQAAAVGVPVSVYIDVSPSDVGWVDLVRELAGQPNIQVLVTVRNEDWQRAGMSTYDFEDEPEQVSLEFDRAEAEKIYAALVAKERPQRFLNFEEAWAAFGGEGPLLEFVYLVTQGGRLRERLEEQIRKLQDRIIAGEREPQALKLLSMVAVASAYDARLLVRPLVAALGLLAPDRSIELLADEYLVRLSDGDILIGGLHPIRSQVLADILTTTEPWSECAAECLPFIHESDIGTFLIYAFSRRQGQLDPLLATLQQYEPDRWVSIAGVLRSLLWLGIREYVNENKPLIKIAAERVGEGWSLLLDFDMVDILEPDSVKFFTEKLATDLRSRQTDKRAIFNRAQDWLLRRKEGQRPEVPADNADWLGMSEVIFWLGFLDIEWPLEWISEEWLDRAVAELPLQTIGYLVSGLERGYGAGFPGWLERHRATMADRFRKEMRTPVLEDDRTKLTAHFIVPVDDDIVTQDGVTGSNKGDMGDVSAPSLAQASKTDGLHNLTIERLELLTRLFPDRELFASQGYGQRVWANELTNDSTYKSGIVRQAFHPEWLVNINSTFRALGELYFRPETWPEYADNVLALRRMVLNLLLQLEKGLAAYFKKRTLSQDEMFYLLGDDERAYVSDSDWIKCTARLNLPPSLPTCLMDEWGLTRESAAQGTRSQGGNSGNSGNSGGSPAGLANFRGSVPPGQYLQPYRPLIKATNDYFGALYRFFSQSRGVMVLNPAIGKRNLTQAAKDRVLQAARGQGIDPDKAPYPVLNFAEAVEVLRPFQVEFRRRLGPVCNADELEKLEQKEQKVLRRVWAMWYFFALEPDRVFQNAVQECLQQFINVVRETGGRLQNRLSQASSQTLDIRVKLDGVTWDGAPVLAVVLDGEDAVEVYQALEKVIQAIQETVPSSERDTLANYALQFVWPNVAIIPLIRGRSASGTAWYINRRVLTSSSMPAQVSWFNLMPKPISADTLKGIEATTWNEPILNTLAEFVGQTSNLSMLVRHLSDFQRMPSVDETGTETVIEYMNRVTPKIEELMQGLLSSASKVKRSLNELAESDGEVPVSFTDGAEMFRLWLDVIENMVPDSAPEYETVSVAQFSEWAPKLDEANNYIALALLCWSSYILYKRESEIGN